MSHRDITNNLMSASFLKLFICICFTIIFVRYVDGIQKLRLKQEAAVVKFANEKYISGVKVFTARRRRSDPYLTNVTVTLNQIWGNNVTCKISYLLPSGHTIDFSYRTCEALNIPWILEFTKTSSNLTGCPTPPGTYRYYNVEIPPKNFPLPLLPGFKKGDSGNVNVNFLKTANNDMLLDIFVTGQKLRLKQEAAVVKFANEKYISGVKVFTARRRRSDPYLTNVTVTLHQTWGNNVTSRISYLLPSGHTIDFSYRTCEALDMPWIVEFTKKYSNITACPTPPGTYRFCNLEIPPKNFPFPLPPGIKKGDTGNVNLKFSKTANNDLLLDIFLTVRVY